jgi:hypothetical protein
LVTGVMISGSPRNASTAELDDVETFTDPEPASLERHHEQLHAHQLLEDHRNVRR